jgi:hypothetical protein
MAKPSKNEGAKSDQKSVEPGEIPENPLAQKLRPDPNLPPQHVVLTGYVGRSGSPDRVRLYRDHRFATYCEVPSEAIIHRWSTVDGDTNAPMSLAVHASAPTDVGRTTNARAAASFLQGPIATTHLACASTNSGSCTGVHCGASSTSSLYVPWPSIVVESCV